MVQLKGEALANFNSIINAEPIQHGTPPPSDQELADSHGKACRCSHCTSMEQPKQSDSNKLWKESIINDN